MYSEIAKKLTEKDLTKYLDASKSELKFLNSIGVCMLFGFIIVTAVLLILRYRNKNTKICSIYWILMTVCIIVIFLQGFEVSRLSVEASYLDKIYVIEAEYNQKTMSVDVGGNKIPVKKVDYITNIGDNTTGLSVEDKEKVDYASKNLTKCYVYLSGNEKPNTKSKYVLLGMSRKLRWKYEGKVYDCPKHLNLYKNLVNMGSELDGRKTTNGEE